MTAPRKRAAAPRGQAAKARAEAGELPARHGATTAIAAVSAKRQVPLAEIITMPSAQNARVLQAWGRVGAVDLSAIADKLRERSRAVIAGDTTSVEALLFDQAVALQAIFTNLSIEASRAEYLGKLEPLLRLALKAQSQSRATLETLATIKNPPVVYARQANIASGPQQVNNGAPPVAQAAPAALAHSVPTELFKGAPHGHRMDAGTSSPASRADSLMAPVGAVDGSEDRTGEGAKQEQPVPRRRASAPARSDADAARCPGRTPRSARSAVGSKRR